MYIYMCTYNMYKLYSICHVCFEIFYFQTSLLKQIISISLMQVMRLRECDVQVEVLYICCR